MLNTPNHFVTDDVIAAHVHFKNPYPDIVIGAGPCRSGTTFYIQVFAQSGFQVWRQPLKSILRMKLHGDAPHVQIADSELVFVKETLGPSTDGASFNPVSVLLKSGVPAERLHFLVITRDPYATVTSWIEQFSHFTSHEDLVNTCLFSYEATERIRQYAKSVGIRTTSLVYDAWRNNAPAVVIGKLFARIGYPPSPTTFSGWKPLKEVEAEGKKIHSIPQPEFYDRNLKSYYEKVNKSTSIVYYPKSHETIRRYLSPANIDQITQSNALRIHKKLIENTERDLNIRIEPDKETHKLLEKS